MSVRIEGSPSGIGRGPAIVARPMSRPSFGGERTMMNFAKYNTADRAVRPSEARSFMSAPKVSPLTPHIDGVAHAFNLERSKVVAPVRADLMVRSENRNVATLPRITTIRHIHSERRVGQPPVRMTHATDTPRRRAIQDTRPVTFSDLKYARTFPMANKEMFFNTKTDTKAQTVFQKTLTSVKAETTINRPQMNMAIIDNKKASFQAIKDRANNAVIIPSEKKVDPSVVVKDHIEKAVSVTPKKKPTIEAIIIPTETRKQVATQVDQAMLRQIKEQLQTLITTPRQTTETSINAVASIQTKPEASSKKALALLTKVTKAEATNRQNPLSPEKRGTFRTLLMKTMKKIENEKQKNQEKKDVKKEERKLRLVRKLRFIHDRKTITNREEAMKNIIRKLEIKNIKKGEMTIDGRDVVKELPIVPPTKFISRVRFQIANFLLPGLVTDGSYDAILSNMAKVGKVLVGEALKLARKFVELFPAVALSRKHDKSTVTKADIYRVYSKDRMPAVA